MSYPPPQSSAPYAPPPQQGYGGYGAYPPPQGGQQQAYYEQQNAPGGYAPQQPQYGGDNKQGMALAPNGFQGERFEPAKPKFRDPIFAVLYLLVLFGFAAVSGISLRAYVTSDTSAVVGNTRQTGVGSTLNGHTAVALMLASGVGLLFSCLYLLAVKVFTRIIIEVTLLLSVATSIAYCAYLWINGQTGGAIVMTIFAVLSVVTYFFLRKRIPLAKALLQAIIRASNEYKSTYVTALLSAIVQTAFGVWTAWTLVAVYVRFSPESSNAGSSSSSGAVTGLIVLSLFNFYWGHQVIKAVAFTTMSGVFGSWYYSSSRVQHASRSSFKRAITYSFGSLCFGSLILAILDILRAIVNVIQQQQAAEGDMVGMVLSCVAGCCLGCLDYLAELFNKFAYANIAMYGNGYITAAKETWRLVRDRGLTAMANDIIVNTVLTMGAYGIGLLCGIFMFAYESVSNPSYLSNGGSLISVEILYAFALGFAIALAVGSVIDAGVTTLFVALAEDPHVLANRDPHLFEIIRSAYPQVVNPVA